MCKEELILVGIEAFEDFDMVTIEIVENLEFALDQFKGIIEDLEKE